MKAIVAMFGMACVGFLSLIPDAAMAQATRTWVSGVGDDVNPCSRTAPCKTFAGAISKTAVGGEINCLDGGGFGGVTITKSLTISCEAGTAGVLVAGTNGITVNDSGSGTPGAALVVLRGLDIDGNNTGLVGVSVVSAARVNIEYCEIRNFRGGTAAAVATSGAVAMTVIIQNSQLLNNGNGVVLNSSGGFKVADISQTTISGSTTNGVGLLTGTVIANITNSVIASNGSSGVVASSATASASVDNSQLTNNGVASLNTTVAGALINASSNKLYGNTAAYSIAAGSIASDGLNKVGPGQGGTVPNGGAILKN